MDTVRMNITLPGDLARRLDKMAGPRRKSRFIAEALKRSFESMKRQELMRLLDEGYRTERSESASLVREYDAADIEGWDEY